MTDYQAKVREILQEFEQQVIKGHGGATLKQHRQATNQILALLDQRAVEAKIEETKLYKQYFNGRTRGYANSRIDELKSQQRSSNG